MMNDTRPLFAKLTNRKPCSWEDVRMPSRDVYSPQMIEALQGKSRLFVGPAVGPYDEVFLRIADAGECEQILVRELFEHDDDLVEHRNVEAYYVNTEGYLYARYAFRLHPEIMRLLKIEGKY